MTTKDFKTNAIELLKFCLAETKETAISDELEDEELELSEAYCEGLEDAIKKIASLPTEWFRNESRDLRRKKIWSYSELKTTGN